MAAKGYPHKQPFNIKTKQPSKKTGSWSKKPPYTNNRKEKSK